METINAKCSKCGYDFEVKLIPTKGVQTYSVFCPRCKEKFKISLNGEKKDKTDYILRPKDYEKKPPEWLKPKKERNDYSLPPPKNYEEKIPQLVRQKEHTSLLPIAGSLLIIAFLMGIICGARVLFKVEEMIERSFGRSGIIKGKVVDENGRPLEGARVEVVDEDISDITDSLGEYELRNVPGGTKKIKASMKGKTSIYKWVLVKSDEHTIDFILINGTGEKEESNSIDKNVFQKISYVCGSTMIIGSIFALLGGISAIKQKNYQLAFIGALMGIASFGFGFSSLLSFIALILIWKSKEFFK